MKRWVISDLHLNDRGKSDDFKGNEKALLKFLRTIPRGSLILNGDILDIWETPLPEIEAAYGALIEALLYKAEYYVLGNHDRAMAGRKEYMGVPVVKHLIIGDTLIMHGHDFDIVNSDGKVLGSLVTRIVSWLERNAWADIDLHAQKLENWVRRQGRFGTPTAYREKALAYISQFEINRRSLRKVILGHTHKVDQGELDSLRYLNCGTWTHGRTDWVEL